MRSSQRSGERPLGHRHVANTNRYVHLDKVTLSEAAERVEIEIEKKFYYPDHFRP